MSKFVLCLTAVGKAKEAERIARRLIRKKLASCVNILPRAVSFYHWKRKLCCSEEFILMIKTISSKVGLLEKELHAVHPYELPEFVILPLVGGSKGYLQWLRAQIR